MVRPKSGNRPAGEDAAVSRLATAFLGVAGPPGDGEVWIGDDAAVVAPPDGLLVLATDAALEGVHADLSLVDLSDLGWKALTATVSDIGAMGARPCHALATFCVPPGTDLDLLAAGVADASARWGCPVVGGDLTSARQVVVSIAATGVLEGAAPPVLRGGAAPGDRLFVTGPLGAAAAGLRVLRGGEHAAGPQEVRAALAAAHRRPLARMEEGVTARRAGATAMIDVSDGLALDLQRLADASGVGVVVDEVPVAPGALEEEALGGGEDYELVVATPDPRALTAAFAQAGLRPPIELGRCVRDPAVRRLRDGPLGRSGYEHTLR